MRFLSGRCRVSVIAFLSGTMVTLTSVAAFRAWGQDRPLSDSFNTEVDADEGSIEALYNFFPSTDRPDELGDLPPARQLAKDRYELAGKSLGAVLQHLLDPPRANTGVPYLFKDQLGLILELARIRTDARLDMAECDEERIEALSAEVAYTRALLNLLRDFQRNGANNVRPSDIRDFDLYRLELEYRLAKLTEE